ncbi:MAG: cupin domain-containing protein [Candidatus Bathyarchaeia archaeon]
MWRIVNPDEVFYTPYPGSVSKIKRIIEGQKIGTKRIAGFGLIEVPPGGVFGPHTHPEREEVYYILAGSGAMIIDDREVPAGEGVVIYLSGEESHGLVNRTDKPLVVVFVTVTK